jgi:hypothetical protein
MLFRLFSAVIFVVLVITKESHSSFRVTLEVSTTTADPRNIFDAPVRPRCPSGERYYKGTCRKVYQRTDRDGKNSG